MLGPHSSGTKKVVGSSHAHPQPHPLHTPQGCRGRRMGEPEPLHSAHLPPQLHVPFLRTKSTHGTRASPRGKRDRQPWGNLGLAQPRAGAMFRGEYGQVPPIPPTFLQPSLCPHQDTCRLPGSLMGTSSPDKNGHRDGHTPALPNSTPHPSWPAGPQTLTTQGACSRKAGAGITPVLGNRSQKSF